MSVLPQTRLARTVVALAAVLCLVILGLLGWRLAGSPAPGSVAVGGPFALTDQSGMARTDRDFRGRYMLVFFGYTNCPGPCPTALNNMTLALNELGSAADKVTPIFITVDPARDTVDAMRGYIPSFHPRFVALTGQEGEIEKVMREYRVIGEPEGGGEGYTIMHSTSIFLMGGDGRYLTHVRSDAAPADIAAAIRRYL